MAHFAVPKIEGGEGEQKQSENNIDCNCLRQECGPRRVFASSMDAALLRGCSGKISETRHPREKRYRRYLAAVTR